MPRLAKRTREKLQELHAQGGAQLVKFKTSDGYGLQAPGRRSISLIRSDGKKTPAGEYWESLTQEQLPEGGFQAQVPVREGNQETIRTRDGKRAVTRRWDPGSGEYKFTALGRSYYRTLRRSYVAMVPVVVKGTRKDGSTYQKKSHLPMEKMSMRPIEVPLHLNLEQRRAYVKRELQRQLSNAEPIYEASDEKWFYDDAGSWAIHEETTGVDPDTGEAESHVILDRRVQGEPGCSTLLFPDQVCEEAFKASDDKLCAPRQMAAILKTDIGVICQALTQISRDLYGTEHWEEQGATPRMILEYCKQQRLGCCVVHNEKVIENLPGQPVLAFTVHANHCYFYSGNGARRALAKRTEAGGAVRLKKAQRAVQTPPALEWQSWDGELKPGHFFVLDEEIESTRAQLLQQGYNPKVLLKDSSRIRTLVCRLGKEACFIHALPEDWPLIANWLAKLNLPNVQYRGEGLPAASLRALQALVRQSRERVWLTGEEKAALLEMYDHRCAQCGSRGELEWDHICRLSESHGPQEFQPLCVECHREKTDHEARTYDADQLASFFEKEVWEQYVASPRPPALVHKLKQDAAAELAELEIADVIRCRRSALLYNAFPLPVFCPLDDIQIRTSLVLGDLNFVTKKLPARASLVSYLGYTGPGWQHRVQTEWLLHTGVIKWEDISHVLTATAHLPAGILAEPLRKMEAAWEGEEVLAKFSVNSLIGLWAIDEASLTKVRTSTLEEDRPSEPCLTSVFHYGENKVVYDFLTTTKLISNSSCRPLHDLCMCTEAVRVGQMLVALKSAGAIPYELKTDSVLYRPRKRRRVELSELSFRDLDTLYSRRYPLASPPVQLTAICSDEKPFRAQKAVERDLMRMDPEMPQRHGELELQSRSWADLDPAQGEERVLAQRGLLVLGIAGTGKTTYCRGLVERLQAQGHKVDIISKTHVASRRAGGVTADHWVRRHVVHGAASCSVLWIDEISQIDVGLLLQISKLTYSGSVSFILSGDWNQFPPIGNNFRGAPVGEDKVMRSNLLHTMCGGNRVTLTECRRSEAQLFDYYSSLIEGGSRFASPLREVIAEAKRAFGFAGFCPANLVISHRKRVLLNERINKQLAPEDAVMIQVCGRTYRGNGAQSMRLWPGIKLLGAVSSEKKGIRNGCLYTVSALDQEHAELEELPGARFSHSEVKQWLRLSHAQTYASVQGTEFEGALRLHDVQHKHFSRRHLFVGLSRAKDAALVSVVD